MKKQIFFSLFLLLGILNSGCIKEVIPKPELPPITHEGLKTFGCYVDGELMTREGSFYVDFGYFRPDINDSLHLTLIMKDNISAYYIRIDMANKIKGVGKYYLGRLPETWDPVTGAEKYVTTIIQNGKDKNSWVEFICAADMYGELNILSYDLQTQKMSGTFEFDAIFDRSWGDVYKPEDFDTVRVRQGRFDYKR